MIELLAGMAALVALVFLIARMSGMLGQDVRRVSRAVRGEHRPDDPEPRPFWTVLAYVLRTPSRVAALTVALVAVALSGAADDPDAAAAVGTLQTVGGACALWALLGYRHFFFGRAVMNRYAEAVELRERRRLDGA